MESGTLLKPNGIPDIGGKILTLDCMIQTIKVWEERVKKKKRNAARIKFKRSKRKRVVLFDDDSTDTEGKPPPEPVREAVHSVGGEVEDEERTESLGEKSQEELEDVHTEDETSSQTSFLDNEEDELSVGEDDLSARLDRETV
jgi:hypothetical protein